MKIFYLITKSNWGGAQKYVYDLATAFSSRGTDVVVAFGGDGELKERLAQKNIRTISIGSLIRDISIAKEIKSIYQLYRVLRTERPDILHINSTKAGAIGAFLGRVLFVPRIVFTVHGAPFREDRPIFMKTALYLVTWATCVLSHKIIVVSKRDEFDLGKMFFLKHKVTTIYPGLTYDEALPREAPKGREMHIITVAELHPNKGYMYGLAAIAKLHEKGIPIKYSIFGEGDDRKKIEEYILHRNLGEVVTLRGPKIVLDREGQNYDIFLLPSIKEGLPYVLIEAGKVMLPVVASITGGIPEIIRHEQTGLLVRPKDVDQLAREIERLIVNRNFAKGLGVSLHNHVVQNFSSSKMLTETAKIYGWIKHQN